MELNKEFEALAEEFETDSELEVSEVRNGGDRTTYWYFV